MQELDGCSARKQFPKVGKPSSMFRFAGSDDVRPLQRRTVEQEKGLARGGIGHGGFGSDAD